MVNLIRGLWGELYDARQAAERTLDVNDVIEALDNLPIKNVFEVGAHCVKLIKAAKAAKAAKKEDE